MQFRVSTRPPAVDGVWLVFVLSFVFFEMLDVDGSHFKMLNTPEGAGLRESTTEESDDGVRRIQQLAVLAWLAITIDLLSIATATLSVGRSRPTSVGVVVGPTHRIALPRASLEITPPA